MLHVFCIVMNLSTACVLAWQDGDVSAWAACWDKEGRAHERA
jgi:hypothetical protein